LGIWAVLGVAIREVCDAAGRVPLARQPKKEADRCWVRATPRGVGEVVTLVVCRVLGMMVIDDSRVSSVGILEATRQWSTIIPGRIRGGRSQIYSPPGREDTKGLVRNPPKKACFQGSRDVTVDSRESERAGIGIKGWVPAEE
jgi:hypothetical protein